MVVTKKKLIGDCHEDREIKMLPACPVETTLTLISDKWKVLILRDLMTGTKRFGELKSRLATFLKRY